jgi:hypothetical protein
MHLFVMALPFLSFGRNVPGKTDPMDGVQGIAEKACIFSLIPTV